MATSKWVERSRAAFVHGAGSGLNRKVNQGVPPNRRNYRFGLNDLLGGIYLPQRQRGGSPLRKHATTNASKTPQVLAKKATRWVLGGKTKNMDIRSSKAAP